ncbi:MAG: YHS domain-containing protein [Nitrospirae bacterium]|nr:YHS domain-containing protein [Nitrospirota bacterium]MBI3377700.1 YHS domain-containing protein [Nitrospirota bacterium]
MKRLAVFTLALLLVAGVTYAAEQANTTEQVKKAEAVGNKICPVSGEKIDEKTKATYEYNGKIYNFCCPMCVEEFKKDPEKYNGKNKQLEVK